MLHCAPHFTVKVSVRSVPRLFIDHVKEQRVSCSTVLLC